MFDDDGPAELRRQRRSRALRRRHPGERPALAGDEGPAAHLPVPDAQRLGLAVLAAGARHRRPDDMVGTDGGLMPEVAERHECRHGDGRALRDPHRLLEVPDRQRIELQNLSPTNNGDFDNTDKVMAFDVDGRRQSTRATNAVPAVLNPANETCALTEGQAVTTRTIGVRCAERAVDHQRADLAGRRRQRLHEGPRPTRSSATSRSGSSRTGPAAGSTRSTSTWSTSRSSAATASRPSRTSWARRTSSTSARTRPSGCS